MDPKIKQNAAAAIFNPPRLVKCKVREHNRYGNHFAGAVIEVTERDYERARHALATPEDERAELAAAAEAAKPSEDVSARFNAFLASGLAAEKQRRAALAERRRLEMEGFVTKPAT